MFSSRVQLALAMATFILSFQLTFYTVIISSRNTKNVSLSIRVFLDPLNTVQHGGYNVCHFFLQQKEFLHKMYLCIP